MFIIPADGLYQDQISNSNEKVISKVYIRFEKLNVEIGNAIDFAKKTDLAYRIKLYR